MSAEKRATVDSVCRSLLTPTQYEYYCLHARGLNGVQIARICNVRPSTVCRGLARAKQKVAVARKAATVLSQAMADLEDG